MPPRPSGASLLAIWSVQTSFALSQVMAASRKKSKKSKVSPICTVSSLDDEYTRVVSSNSFYLKQITWCINVVGDYWVHVRSKRNGVWPPRAPMTVRFCISWLSGRDCTTWTAHQVHFWLKHNIGADQASQSLVYVAWANKMDPCPRVGPAKTLLNNPKVYRAVSRMNLAPVKRFHRFGYDEVAQVVPAFPTTKSPFSIDSSALDPMSINL